MSTDLTPTSGSLLLSAACDIRDRYLRFLHGLAELRRHPDPGVKALLTAADGQVRHHLLTFEVQLAEALDQRHLEEHPDRPDTWSNDYQGLWPDLTRNGMRLLAGEHRALIQYLPVPQTPPADIGFFLARGVDLSPTRPSHQERFSLSYSRFMQWETLGIGVGRKVPAVPVPFAETLTPLRWPILLHELGHHLLPTDDATRRTQRDQVSVVLVDELGPNATAGQVKDLSEVLADRVAERTCGISYALALLREFQLVVMEKHNTDRSVAPPLLSRLRLLAGWDRLEPQLPTPWRALLDRDVERDLSAERAIAIRLMPDRDGPVRPDVVRRAAELLNADQPAGSVLSLPRPTQAALAKAAAGRLQPDALDELFLSAAEAACHDSEILDAAWALESCRPAEHYLSVLLDSLVQSGSLDSAKVDLQRLERARRDTAISRSLQAAAVHRWLVKHDADIASRTAALNDGSPSTSEEASASERGSVDRTFAQQETEGPTPRTETAGNGTGVMVSLPSESSPLADTHLLRRLTSPDLDRLVVRPLVDPAQVGGTTVDLRLGTEWETLRTSRFAALSPADDVDTVTTLLDASVEQFRLTAGQNQGLVLHPGELMLALTLEYLSLPPDLWGNLEGRSTWARIGLQVHASAGMVDAGFDGYLTLELQNTGRLPLVLYPGLRVAQMAFFPVSGVARHYKRKAGAAYSDQTSARTAFPSQHEHEALRQYQASERVGEQLDRAAPSPL